MVESDGRFKLKKDNLTRKQRYEKFFGLTIQQQVAKREAEKKLLFDEWARQQAVIRNKHLA